MIYESDTMPEHAQIGDAWTDGQTFKRVLSRGRSWENVPLGANHPDEADHEQQLREREAAEQKRALQVSGGTSESTQGNGDDGQSSASTEQSQQDTAVTAEVEPEKESAGEGVDGNGSPVL